MANKKQNTPGVGTEYEIVVPALFALRLNQNEDVKEFSIRSNVSTEFGNMDDVIIDMTMNNCQSLHFAFQLKHKEKKNANLLPSNFEAKGDFTLEKYCKAFKQLNEDTKNRYNFILYTNANFDKKRKNEVTNFTMVENDKCLGKLFFDTGLNLNIYKFQTKDTISEKEVTKDDYDNFFANFSLYTCQKNFQDFETEMFDILKDNKIVISYLDLFRKWHQGSFTNKTIDRQTINIHLIDIFLSSSIITNCHLSKDKNNNMRLFEEAIIDFDVTVINEDKKNVMKYFHISDDVLKVPLNHQAQNRFERYLQQYKISGERDMLECLVRLAKEFKLIQKLQELDDTTKVKVFFYLLQNVLFLNFNEHSKELIYQGIKLYQIKEDRMKFLIIGDEVKTTELLPLQVFQNLEDVSKNYELYQQLMETCRLSLQGRDQVTVNQLSAFLQNSAKVFETKEIIQMLQNNFLIGERKITLPPFYASRKVSTIVFDIEAICSCAQKDESIVVIESCNEIEQMPREIRSKIIDIMTYIENPQSFDNSAIIVSRNEDHNEMLLKKIKTIKPNMSVHLFKAISNNLFILVKSTSSLDYAVPKAQKIDENDIHLVFKGTINLLVAEPGMGKTTMMKYLRNQCPWHFWTVHEDLKTHYHFFTKQHTEEEVLSYFMKPKESGNVFLERVLKEFYDQRKVVFFLDGLDELPSPCIDNVLKGIDDLSKMGFRIWISSRENLEEQLLKKFYIFSIDIVEFSEEQQKKYVHERLNSQYKEEEIESLVLQIFSSIQVVNNTRILGIPLQLYILTQIFLDERQNYENIGNFLVLTKMYKYFFDGRYRHCVDKFKQHNNSPFIKDSEEYLEQYEILALKSFFDDDVVGELQLDLWRFQKFTDKIKKDKDPLGIVKTIDGEKAIFEHYTYGEYFASNFICKNFDKADILKDHLLSNRYRNLMLILNIMLCEDNPLHLAVIYGNLSQVEEYIDDSKIYDKGGRNPLHVVVGICKRFTCRSLNSFKLYGTKIYFERPQISPDTRTTEKNIAILKKLVVKFSPYECDLLFKKDALSYAIVQKSLLAVDIILENHGMSYEAYEKFKKYEYIGNPDTAYFCTIFGYVHLLTVALDKKYSKIVHMEMIPAVSETLLHYVPESHSLKRIEIADILINYGCSIHGESYWRGPLHAAVKNNDLELTKFFLEKGASIENLDRRRETVLHVAVKEENIEMVTFLLNRGSNVKVVNTRRQQPKHYAIQTQQLQILKLLLLKDTISNDKDRHFHNIMLHDAVSTNNIEIITYVLDQGIDINYYDDLGRTPMHAAAEIGSYKVVMLLLKNGANALAKTERDVTTLHCAVFGNNVDIVEIFLKKGVDINARDAIGETPLFVAFRKKSVEIISLLLKNGARTDQTTQFEKNTVLHVACATADVGTDIIKLLLKHDSDVNAENNNKETPLIVASRCGNTGIFKTLIKHGANINCVSLKGSNIWTFLSTSEIQKHKELVRYLVEAGTTPNLKIVGMTFTKAKVYGTPLSKAIASNCMNLAKTLLEFGANANDILALQKASTNKGYLELLLQRGLQADAFNEEEVDTLFKTQIDKNVFDLIIELVDQGMGINLGKIIIQIVLGGTLSENEIQICINKGADINVKNENDETPIYLAVALGRTKTVELLADHRADINTLTTIKQTIWNNLCKNFSLDVIRLLLDKNANPNLRDGNGFSPLYYAVNYDRIDIVQLLIRNSADINDVSAFKRAVEKSSVSIINQFFESGFQIFNNEPEHQSIMSTAGSIGNCTVIDSLLLRGFDINHRNASGETALILAAKNRYLEAVKLLVLRGANINCRSANGKTMWDYLHEHNPQMTSMILGSLTKFKLKNTQQNSFLHYAIRHQDEELINTVLRFFDIDVNDDLLIAEAILTKNPNILRLLLVKGFEINDNVSDMVESMLHQRRNFDMLKKMKEQYKQSVTCDHLLYTLLHLAVYLADFDTAEFVFRQGIDLDSVDVYNPFYPLHFALDGNVLKLEGLKRRMTWIQGKYQDEIIWELEDMRRYILKRFPLNERFQRRKRKTSYLTEIYTF